MYRSFIYMQVPYPVIIMEPPIVYYGELLNDKGVDVKLRNVGLIEADRTRFIVPKKHQDAVRSRSWGAGRGVASRTRGPLQPAQAAW